MTIAERPQTGTARPRYELTRWERRFIGGHIWIAIVALGIGSVIGPLQALEYSNVDLYQYLEPILQSYYQGLTLHGVLNALVWTTFFIVGFTTLTTIVGLRRPLSHPNINLAGFVTMVVGLLLAAVPLLLDQATVLYTFYPPLEASWAFYVGLTLVVVGSWIEGVGFYLTLAAWRKENRGVRSPFVALGGVINAAMWQIATLGIAVEMLTMLIPWSLGITDATDPELARTYFWFTGHPLVYFWLLPAYVSWYGMLPKQAGGKLFSDSLARLAFWMFLIVSVPVGFHHQFVDPGVPQVWKWIHALLTYSVFFPSMLTAFTVIASLEYAARKRGGTGLIGWVRALPWDDPSVAAQLLAGILFMFGGIGGLTNASYNINLVIHNTAWVPGHFHLTVATAVTLSFIGITYWMVPMLTGKQLWGRRIAVAQAWTWFVGMVVFSNAMHMLGLLGAPRRTPLGDAPYVPEEWDGHLLRVSIGGTILLAAVLMYLLVMYKTVRGPKAADPADVPDMPIAESLRHPQLTPVWLDRFKPWLIAAGILLVLAYGPQLVDQILNMNLNAPGVDFEVW
ncbi:MAG: cbb3-type cytochrome c oxidase subunit I [Ilumatobacter sp.]|uniref:cbb3-type cytochrome c oxidase subunit I n=1 Tax=Ilumatobacter sp. TaxID=1967498 RepID=UPI0026289DBC|nr:cbb3-type cytochrome c oxidase subunit I [Ilumatobacter sp.]MDJ0767571.1 cbb3-type cytochrome c oxidase subunit I [Ilumatobacter sp.]